VGFSVAEVGARISVQVRDRRRHLISAHGLGFGRSQLRLELLVEFTDPSYFTFQLFTILSHFAFLLLHARCQLLERVSLIFEIAVLRLQNLFIFVKEVTELINFRIFKHLEALESRRNLIWRWNLTHFRYGLSEELILSFDECLVIPEQVFELLDARDLRIFVLGFINLVICIQDPSVVFLIEDLQTADLFIN
jgi:hypothetical protein